ncbi:MAG: tetratricopeptide repeat protein [Chloroflexi bacterium]|nr:tetratricopeptide repeat protein [Chloroflexota bacterium]
MAPYWLSFVPHNFAADLLADPAASPVGREQRFQAVGLFVDISGFTAMSEALSKIGRDGSEEMTTALNGYFAPMIDLIQSYGGIVAKFGGDALTVLFPFDSKSRQSAARQAVQCALDMQAAMSRYAAIPTSAGTFRLAMKAGLASGPVFCATVGDASLRLEYVVAGRVLDRCAEAQHFAEPGDVVAHNEVLALLGEADSAPTRDESFSRVLRLGRPEPGKALPPLAAASPESVHQFAPYLHPVIAQRLELGEAQFVNEHRSVTVLFIGFDEYDYDTDPLAGIRLERYFAQVVQIIHRYDGSLNKIDMGDKGSKFIALFGAPVAHEDDAERALRCALDLMAIPDDAPALRIGVATEFVYCGLVGGSTRQEYAVMGDGVNLAARLMQKAQPGQMLVSDSTRHATPRHSLTFKWEPLGPIIVKGKAQPVETYQLAGLGGGAAPRLPEPQYALPMVGRAAELDVAQSRLAMALANRGQIIGITAEAGMGKSRLAAEIIKIASDYGMYGYGGACLSYGTKSNYLVWRDVLRGLFGLDSSWSLDQQTHHLECELAAVDRLAQAAPLLPRLPLLGVALNLPIPDNDLTHPLDARTRKTLLESLIVEYARYHTSLAPLLLVLEDCHWIDPLSLDLLEAISRHLQNLPVLLVMLYRPPELDDGGGAAVLTRTSRVMNLPHATELRLNEFTPGEAERLITLKLAQLFGENKDVPPTLLNKITERAQGNPFYIDELINLIHDQKIDPGDSNALKALELPDSLHSLILSRLDQLDEGAKTTIKVASVMGRLFKADWLWQVYPELGTPEEVRSHLTRLSRLDLTPLDKPDPELEYLFKHIVTRDVAYESLSIATRTMLHEQVGRFLERLYTGDFGLPEVVAHLDLLAYHYGLSKNVDKQREYFRKAGEAAQAAYANDAALHHFRALLPLLKDGEKFPILLKQGQVLELVGEWVEAERTYHQALTLATGQGELKSQTLSQQAIGNLLERQGDHTNALDWLKQARAGFTELNDPAGVSDVLEDIGSVYWQQGDYEAARALTTESLNLCRTLGDKKCIAHALQNLGNVAFDQDDYDAAQELYQESLELWRELGNRLGAANLLSNLGLVARNHGSYETARELFEESLNMRRELGDRWGIADSLNCLGDVAKNLGALDRAQILHEESWRLFQEMGDKGRIAGALDDLGVVAYLQHDDDKARAFFEESVAMFRELQEKPDVANSLNNLGLAVAKLGNPARAADLFRESLTLCHELGDKLGVAENLAGLAGVAATGKDLLGLGDLTGLKSAARLAGAVHALLDQINAVLGPADRADYEQLLADLREKLGEEVFNKEWNEGLKMGPDETVAHALAGHREPDA